MSKPLLQHGDTFKINGTEFEVVTISTNEARDEHVYEIKTKADADKKREEDAQAAAQAAREAAKTANAQ